MSKNRMGRSLEGVDWTGASRWILLFCWYGLLCGCRPADPSSASDATQAKANVVADTAEDVQAISASGAKLARDSGGNVTEVDFRGVAVDDGLLGHISGLPKLRSIRLNDTGIGDSAMDCVGNVATLERLDLRGCAISNDGLARLASLKRLRAVQLMGKDGRTTVDDEGLRVFSGMQHLKALALDHLWISEDGLAYLENCVALEELYLAGTLIDDAAAERFKKFPKLRKLRLAATRLGNEGLKALGQLEQLKELDLSENSQILDDGLVHLQPLTGLTRLNLWRVGVTDAGIAHLAGMTRLAWLNLDNTKLSDQGLVYLEGMKELKFLHLGSTEVTDNGLVHLASLKSLADLKVTRTAVTAEGVAMLQKELPDTQIQLKYVEAE